VWSTSRGHLLTVAETRWAGCDAVVTPVLVGSEVQCGSDPTVPAASQMEMIDGAQPAPEARIAALAATLFDARIPMDLGRSARTASAGQRRALAARDRGCIMPGCGVPAEACQTHHLQEWSEGGTTDLANMALLCWAHHRQVDLRMWTIEPRTTPPPASGGPPPESAGTRWPANNGAPFTVSKVPRHAWRP
jgi:hypothetical protein